MRNKHAYLIIAHNNFKILEKLIMLLDDERNDIYLHIDKKVKKFNGGGYLKLVNKSNLYIIKNRIDVQWGDVSQIKCELELFKKATENGVYQYYHLLSGVDMPLNNQDFMHAFFNEHRGREFITFTPHHLFKQERLRNVTIFPICRRVWSIYGNTMRSLNKISYKIQKRLKYDYIKNNLGILQTGGNWTSLTDDAVRYIIKQMNKDIKWYKYCLCGDEIYKHTILYNSHFKDKISSYGCLRFTDWTRGKPYTFTKEDFDMLINSDKFFARKFEESVDFEVVEKIYNYVKQK